MESVHLKDHSIYGVTSPRFLCTVGLANGTDYAQYGHSLTKLNHVNLRFSYLTEIYQSQPRNTLE